MIKKRCKITFVVHGSTIYTSENRVYEENEYPPLDENGKYEIEKLTNWLKKRSPRTDKIYTAPTLRSIHSADIISKSYNQPFEVLEALETKKEGIWAGYSYHEIEERFPQMLDAYHTDPENFSCPEGETMLVYNKRVSNLTQRLKDQDFGRRIIIVCDASFVRAVISNTFNMPVYHQNRINLQTGSATQINFYQDWPILVYSNYIPQ